MVLGREVVNRVSFPLANVTWNCRVTGSYSCFTIALDFGFSSAITPPLL